MTTTGSPCPMSEQQRTKHIPPHLDLERSCWDEGARTVAGVDEVGRGAWAGPVVAAAVVLPPRLTALDALDGVRDSKTLSSQQREYLAARIVAHALAIGIGMVGAADVDRLGVLRATASAMGEALRSLNRAPQRVLIDGLPVRDLSIPHSAVVRGDAISLSIAAASIVAKVARDRWMIDLDARYPGYLFGAHKGYGTAAHREALCRLGPCAEHRRTYAPVAAIAAQQLV